MEHGPGPGWVGLLEASALADFMRQSFVAYPLANTAHVLGLALLVGAIVALDLRLLGLGRALPVVPTSRFLTAIALAGLAVAVPTGLLMLAADATAVAGNPSFQLKLVLLGLALGNALLWRRLWAGRLAGWDAGPPMLGRVQAAGSILLWVLVVASGRMIAYL